MAIHLLCPSCATHLNPRDDLVLTGVNGSTRGLILLHPEPGDYRASVSDGFPLKKGDVVEFLCPICQANLVSKLDPNLVQLSYANTQSGEKGIVVFSRVYGDHATFVINKRAVASYGENAASYADRGLFIGLRWD